MKKLSRAFILTLKMVVNLLHCNNISIPFEAKVSTATTIICEGNERYKIIFTKENARIHRRYILSTKLGQIKKVSPCQSVNMFDNNDGKTINEITFENKHGSE